MRETPLFRAKLPDAAVAARSWMRADAAQLELVVANLAVNARDVISGNAQNLRESQMPKGAAFLQKPFRLAALAEQLKLVPRKV
jgi:hypothetical protein